MKYYDSCPECESLNVEAKVVSSDNKLDPFFRQWEVLCRDCGAEWVDILDDAIFR